MKFLIPKREESKNLDNVNKNSKKEAANKENNGIRISIDNVVHGKRKTLKGFIWKFLD